MSRVQVTPKMARKLYEKNAYSCCVCKRTGIGLNLHHIDGDSSNTSEENLAVLCVSDHDAHHEEVITANVRRVDVSAEEIRIIFKDEEDAVAV